MVKIKKQLCKCGCGQLTSGKWNSHTFKYSEFVKGHQCKGEHNGMYGKKHSKEAKEKMSINRKGKKFTQKKYQHINIKDLLKDYEELNKKELSKKYNCSYQFVGRKIKECMSLENRKKLETKHKGHGKGGFEKGHLPWNTGKTLKTHYDEIKILSDGLP